MLVGRGRGIDWAGGQNAGTEMGRELAGLPVLSHVHQPPSRPTALHEPLRFRAPRAQADVDDVVLPFAFQFQQGRAQ